MELACSVTVNASKESIWAYYVDTEKRMSWEEDLESLTHDGGIATGTTGVMKLKGMPAMPFILARVVEHVSHWDQVGVPGRGTLVFKHDISEEHGNVLVTHTVSTNSGPDDDEATAMFLQKVFADVPLEMMKLKRLAETV